MVIVLGKWEDTITLPSRDRPQISVRALVKVPHYLAKLPI
jgi:hypothetical protein